MTDKFSLSRRSILAGPVAGLAATALTAQVAGAQAINDDVADLRARRDTAKDIRDFEAQRPLIKPVVHHSTNGDEDEITENGRKTYIANYSKGLLHNEFGEVMPNRYEKMIKALKSGNPDDFEDITLSDLPVGEKPAALDAKKMTAVTDLIMRPDAFFRLHAEASLVSTDIQRLRLVNPQGGLAYDLEGGDSHAFAMPAPPSFRSKEILGEMAENYWMAILRDIPFSQYGTNPDAAKAISSLNTFSVTRWPRSTGDHGMVTDKQLFRGDTDGDLVGPYVSQFLLAPVPFGAYLFDQQILFSFVDPVTLIDPVYMTSANAWVDAQNGKIAGLPQPGKKTDPSTKKVIYSYIHRGRDLANFVHVDELFQAYLNAALLMGSPPERGGYGVQHNSGNPYDGFDPNEPTKHRRSTQGGFATLGEPAFKSMVAEIATRALKAVWYEKWFVNRRLRPEVFAGRVHFHKTAGKNYPFEHSEFAKLDAMLPDVQTFNVGRNKDSTYFLPMAFPEGSPAHPSYGAGHATVAGACVTLLKGFYEGSMTFADLNAPVYEVNDNGQAPLVDIRGAQPGIAAQLTIEGELNKLASNISLGRNFAGVHWRSDHIESLRLGEMVALRYLQEIADTHNETVSFNLRKFDGTQIGISKTL